MSCGIDLEGNPGIIWTQQGQNLKLTIDQWTSAFNIFMSVYLEKEGNEREAPFLCKHADVFRELATLHGDWFMYDEQFRKNRARTGCSWANKHNELYCKAVAWGVSQQHQQITSTTSKHKNRSGNSFRNNSGKDKNQPFRAARFAGDRVRGTCWAFNGGERLLRLQS